jgi:hypothetical protein
LTQAYLLFHLNLAFSSIEEKQRPVVIEHCYSPLLDLIEHHNLPIGVEMSGWTLRQIQQIAPDWIARFRSLLSEGRCELIGSGYTQLIGPLVPHTVNQWNQRLGLDDYQAILGQRPNLALVNEMAFSSGLVPIYLQAGYHGIIMDRDNVRLALALEDQPYEAVPSHAIGPAGECLPVLWSDSILFQKLQRFAHGEIGLDDYLHYFRKRAATAARPLAAYCNDAEIFDFRPGRFATEPAPQTESEWRRVAELLVRLRDEEAVVWLTPSAALAASVSGSQPAPRTLSSIRQPVPVKKQAKYNLARWAVSGRNDLWLNSCCHYLEQQLANSQNPQDWRKLCELWASDLRTHITGERWEKVRQHLSQHLTQAALPEPSPTSSLAPPNWHITHSPDGIFLTVETTDLHLILKRRKGLTVHSLAFRSQGFVPVVGTLPHGYFESIEYGADFYTGGVIVELPGEHQRITDLLPAEARFHATDDELSIFTRIDTACGPIEKTLTLQRQGERLSLAFAFPGWSRPRGIVRVGTTTLMPEAFHGQLEISCKNGGSSTETFPLDSNCDHCHPSSSLVSSTTGLGATSGEIRIGDASRSLRLSWNPAHTAAFPMLIHQRIPPTHLTRLVFSLSELDDTSRPDGDLPGFTYTIEALTN